MNQSKNRTAKRKYYFMDYTKRIDLAKRIKSFLDKEKKEEFHYKELGRFLKKQLYKQEMTYKNKDGKTKYFKHSLIQEDVLFQIQNSFRVLEDLGYLESFYFEHLPKQDSYLLQVVYTDEQGDFSELVKESIYFPIKGEKQQLSDSLRQTIESEYFIDYEAIINDKFIDYKEQAEHLQKVLPDIWNKHYDSMTKVQTFIHKVQSEFTFLFDIQSYSYEEDYVEDRVVVTYGFSKQSELKRNSSRMAGYLKGAGWDWTDKNTDKGHFIGHSLGGKVDENLFPQSKDINRGLSPRGKVYRTMEKYCADNEGTFCFSRPIYCDFSTRPFVLEYGVLMSDGTLWVERFDNV